MQSKGVGKFRSKQFGCKKRLDLLTVDVLNGFFCNTFTFQALLMLQISCSQCRGVATGGWGLTSPPFVANVTSYLVTFIRIRQNIFLYLSYLARLD